MYSTVFSMALVSLNWGCIWKQTRRVVCLIAASPAALWGSWGEELCYCCHNFLAHCFIFSPFFVPGTWQSINLCGLNEEHIVDAQCLLVELKKGRVGGSAASLPLGGRIKRRLLKNPFPGCWSQGGALFSCGSPKIKKEQAEGGAQKGGCGEKKSRPRFWAQLYNIHFDFSSLVSSSGKWAFGQNDP